MEHFVTPIKNTLFRCDSNIISLDLYFISTLINHVLVGSIPGDFIW